MLRITTFKCLKIFSSMFCGTSLGCICSGILIYYKIFLIKRLSHLLHVYFWGGLTSGIRMVVSAIGTKLMLQYVSSKQKPCPRLSRTPKMGNAFDQQLRKVEVQVLVKLPNWIDYDSSLVWSSGGSPAFLTGGLRKISPVSLLGSPKFYSFVIRTPENKICGLLLPSFL